MSLNILDLVPQEGYVSGEMLAHEFGVSRTAVWKEIRKLKAQGFDIDGTPRLGYQLISCPDKLLPILIRRRLTTRAMGKSIYYYPSINSTNQVSKKLAQEGASDGTVVVCEVQTEGRGRLGRQWLSAPGENLLLSIILRPQALPTEVSRFAILGILSAAEAIHDVTGIEAQSKWPNEITIDDKKVGGVLAEFGAEIDKVDFIILGIGINVNSQPHNLPKAQYQATSLFNETGREVSRVKLLRTLLKTIEENYQLVQDEGPQPIQKKWRATSREWGRWVKVNSARGTSVGIAKGIDENGALIIGNEGEERVPMGGDVQLELGGRSC